MSNSVQDLESLKGSTVLVTGAGGFIGTHLLAKLKFHGAKVIAVGRTAYDGIHVADVADFNAVKKCFELSQKLYDKPIEYVFHLAGQKSAGISRQFPFETLQESFQSTLNVLEIARTRTEIKKIILISSLAVYGQDEGRSQNLHNESDNIRADSVYSATKIMSEFAGLSYWRDFGLNVTIARLANVYGPGQSKLAVIPYLISQMMTSNEVTMGNADSVRDFIFVDDVVMCLLSLALCKETSGCAYNVGTGQGTSIKEIVATLSRILKFTGNINIDPSKLRENEKPYIVSNIQSVKEVTGWFPRIELDSGLHQTVAYERDCHQPS